MPEEEYVPLLIVLVILLILAYYMLWGGSTPSADVAEGAVFVRSVGGRAKYA